MLGTVLGAGSTVISLTDMIPALYRVQFIEFNKAITHIYQYTWCYKEKGPESTRHYHRLSLVWEGFLRKCCLNQDLKNEVKKWQKNIPSKGHRSFKGAEATWNMLSFLTYSCIHTCRSPTRPGSFLGTGVTIVSETQPTLTTSNPFGTTESLLGHD